MTYTTYSEISNELGGYTINASSVPSSTTVNSWIADTEKIIDNITGTTYTTATATSEYYDYDGQGYMFLNNAPLISVTKLEKETKGIDAETSSWTTLTEGRILTTDYYVYEDEAEIRFHGTNKPVAGYQNIRVTYTYGHATVPYDIKRLATLITARRVINSIINNSATEEGGAVSVGTIRVSDPSSFSNNHIKEMVQEENRLINNIGRFKVYRFKRTYDNY